MDKLTYDSKIKSLIKLRRNLKLCEQSVLHQLMNKNNLENKIKKIEKELHISETKYSLASTMNQMND